MVTARDGTTFQVNHFSSVGFAKDYLLTNGMPQGISDVELSTNVDLEDSIVNACNDVLGNFNNNGG